MFVLSRSSFNAFLGFEPDHINFAANINGDDAIELFCGGVVIDVFGLVDVDGSGQPWEYTDGWAYRNSGAIPNFGLFDNSNWSFSGINVLDGEDDNGSAAIPFPIGTFLHTDFSPICADSSHVDSIELLFVSANLNPCQDEVNLSLDSKLRGSCYFFHVDYWGKSPLL